MNLLCLSPYEILEYDFKENLANSENMIQGHMTISLWNLDVYGVKTSLRLVHVVWAPKDRERKKTVLWSMWWGMPQFKKISSRGMIHVFNVENLLLSVLATSIIYEFSVSGKEDEVIAAWWGSSWISLKWSSKTCSRGSWNRNWFKRSNRI